MLIRHKDGLTWFLYGIVKNVEDAEDSGRLYAALNAIPEEYATAIYLQYIERLSPEQTAKIMKKSLKQIYNLTSRAKVRLRQELE